MEQTAEEVINEKTDISKDISADEFLKNALANSEEEIKKIEQKWAKMLDIKI